MWFLYIFTLHLYRCICTILNTLLLIEKRKHVSDPPISKIGRMVKKYKSYESVIKSLTELWFPWNISERGATL